MTLAWLIPGAMALVLLGLAVLIRLGGRDLQRPAAAVTPVPGGEWPAATIIIPATGADPGLADNLRSLLNQEYPDFQVIVTTRDTRDPAVPIIRQTIRNHPGARHVCSGRAMHCSQKNHNLLAGVREAGALPEVLVFCDSTRLAPADMLQELIRPIALHQAQVTSGYHHVIPEKNTIVPVGHAIITLLLFLMKNIRRFSQPWGGCTAIRRTTFEGLQVARLWSRNIVDDVSLAALLLQYKVKVIPTPPACLATRLPGESAGAWRRWLTRQIIYLKFCFPVSWLFLGLVLYLMTFLLLYASASCLLLPLTGVSPASPLAGGVFLFCFLLLGVRLRQFHPARPPLYIWLAATYLAFIMAGWCHFCTLFSMKVQWRGVSYRVTWQGTVTNIDR